MFLGLPDRHPSVRGTDPYPSIIKQKKNKKNLYRSFVTSLWLFICEEWCKCIFKSTGNEQKLLLESWRSLKKRAGTGSESVSHDSRGTDPRIRSKISDPEHCSEILVTDLMESLLSCAGSLGCQWRRIRTRPPLCTVSWPTSWRPTIHTSLASTTQTSLGTLVRRFFAWDRSLMRRCWCARVNARQGVCETGCWWESLSVRQGVGDRETRSGETGCWWDRVLVWQGVGETGRWCDRALVWQGVGETGCWWDRVMVRQGVGLTGCWFDRVLVRQGAGEIGCWWDWVLVRLGVGETGYG